MAETDPPNPEPGVDPMRPVAWLDTLPFPCVLTDGIRGPELARSRDAASLLGPAGSSPDDPWPTLADSLADRSALTRMLGAGLTGALLLQDGGRVRWTCRRVDTAATSTGYLHTFERIAAPVSTPTAVDPSDRLFRLTFEEAAVAMVLVAPDLRILRANRAFASLVDYPIDRLLELRLDGMAVSVAMEQQIEEYSRTARDSHHLECQFRRGDGAQIWLHLTWSVVRDPTGIPAFYLVLAEDETLRRRSQLALEQRTRELEAMATTDPLTGLHNYRFLQDFLSQRLLEARRANQALAVLMLDLDDFRQVNERFGHDAGNVALRAVADAIRHAIREEDVACRFGGEEFSAVLLGAGAPGAEQVAERIRRRIATTRILQLHGAPLTASIGVSVFPVHGSGPASLLKAADLALYRAKRLGKNQVVLFEPSFLDRSHRDPNTICAQLAGAGLEALQALVTAVDLQDHYSGAHAARVTRLVTDLATRLGCTTDEIADLSTAAGVLDVGKVVLPDEILTKSERLSRRDWELMRQHPEWGAQFVSQTTLPSRVAEIVREHHERLDGSGYPHGLRGDQLCPLSRIMHVAEAAAALRDERPHRRSWPRARVVSYLAQQVDKKLDREVVEAFLAIFGAEDSVAAAA